MNNMWILGIFLGFYFLETVFSYTLAFLNRSHVKKNATIIPDIFKDEIDSESLAKATDYTLTHSKLGLIAGAISAVAFLGVLLSGLLGIINHSIMSIPIHSYLQGIIFLSVMGFIFSTVDLPFSLYSIFHIEAKFGFNRTTLKTFFLDKIKGLAISAVSNFPVILGLFWLADNAGSYWWLIAFGGMTIYSLIMGIVHPMVIAPLFNKYTPLPEGALKDKIMSLAKRLNFKTSGIYVEDSSKRSSHSNAYFTGIGKSKRIVLCDTLINTHTEDEIAAVLAHEIGHEKKNHIKKGMAMNIAFSFVGFFAVSLLINWTPLYQAFGLVPCYASLLFLLSSCSGVFTFWLTPIFSSLSRKHEYEADTFAVRGVGTATGLVSALKRLSKHNLSNLHPHPWYSFVYYSHPTLPERIAAMEKAEKIMNTYTHIILND